MKKVSELGLEVIQLEDQILLVKEIKHSCGPWILQNNKQYSDEIIRPSHERDFGSRDKDIVASTKQLEGLPVLVIEDEFIIAENMLRSDPDFETEGFSEYQNGRLNGIIEGYNEARQIYKFTEEDLRKAFWFGKEWLMDLPEEYIKHNYGISNSDSMNDNQVFDAFVESITKKELWIEAEEKHFRTVKNEQGQVIDHEFILEPKITDNQIKAVWK